MRFEIFKLYVLLLCFIAKASEYESFLDAYCYPVNATLTCSSLQECRDLCSDISSLCCGFYHPLDNPGLFSMCTCSNDLRVYRPNIPTENYELYFPLDNYNTLTCEQFRQDDACDFHDLCEWDSNVCIIESNEATSPVLVLGIVFLSLCGLCSIFATYFLYTRNFKIDREVKDTDIFPDSPKRPYESPKGDGPKPKIQIQVQGEPDFMFPPEGEGKRMPMGRQGEQSSLQELATPRTPSGGGEDIGESHNWTPDTVAIALPADAEDADGEADQIAEPGEMYDKRTPEREHRESLVYRL